MKDRKSKFLLCAYSLPFVGWLAMTQPGYGQSIPISSDISEIVHLETALRQAMLDSDVDKLDDLMSDDLIFTDHTGALRGKQNDIQAHRSGMLKINELEPLNQIVRRSGDTAVVSACLAIKGTFGDAAFSEFFRFTRVWAKQETHWSIVAAHSSVVECQNQ